MKRPQIHFRRPQRNKLHKNNQYGKRASLFFILVGVCMMMFISISPIDYIPIGTILAGLIIREIFE